jgi:hypothetical protein
LCSFTLRCFSVSSGISCQLVYRAALVVQEGARTMQERKFDSDNGQQQHSIYTGPPCPPCSMATFCTGDTTFATFRSCLRGCQEPLPVCGARTAGCVYTCHILRSSHLRAPIQRHCAHWLRLALIPRTIVAKAAMHSPRSMRMICVQVHVHVIV